MDSLSFSEIELSGARVTVPFTALQRLGPKHHAIVIGQSDDDGEVWMAELSRKHGYRLVSLKSWLNGNQDYLDGLKIEPNLGPRSNWDVAQSAIDEVIAENESGKQYNVVFNNCETFANRHLSGTTSLSPQVKKTFRMLGFVAASGALILQRHLKNRTN